jgi:hypothetical protein
MILEPESSDENDGEAHEADRFGMCVFAKEVFEKLATNWLVVESGGECCWRDSSRG